MNNRIHPTAVIHPSASLGTEVEIGPFVVIGPKVEIGDRTRLLPHVHLVTRTRVGTDCLVCSSAVVGGDPQDLKFKGEDTDVIIGNRTRIGEFATINRGTGVGGGETRIGDDCLIMAYVHVAHDCIIGNQVIITNCTQLAGHIRIEDQAWISSSCQIHHFVTIGSMSFLAPSSGLHFDVPPYMIVEGFRDTCQVRSLNIEGLHRRNVPPESIAALKKAYRIIYRQDNKTRAEALAELAQSEISRDPCVANLLAHVKASYEGKQNRALEKFRNDKIKSAAEAGN
ncbi:MAG: acyl-ACP--UDP-N-acetylglucosamine O-acyltransferase [Planctomycetota bacterium]|jgi:UDP-N-acetylglucosamine acyltransferase|nr:acyl-ACP--UDP-N-acetylglucosamine O-acyltransferase [Planctomycetota bacterium]